MKKLLLASHKTLAADLKDTLDFIIGKTDYVDSLCLYSDDNPDAEKAIREYMSLIPDGDETHCTQ